MRIRLSKFVPLFLLFFVLIHNGSSAFAAEPNAGTNRTGELSAGDGTTHLDKPQPEDPGKPYDSSVNVVGSLVKVIIVLIVIIGMIVLLIKFLAQKNRTAMSNRGIRVLGGVGLGPNKSLQIVELGTSIYVIGVGENIQLLDKISDLAEAEQIIDSLQSEGTGANDVWKQLISGFSKIKRNKNREAGAASEDLPNEAFQKLFQDRLKRLSGRKQMLEEMLEQDQAEDRKNEL